MGPEEAIAFFDRYVSVLDQTPVNVQSTLKLYPLRHASASQLRQTLRGIFRSRFQSQRNQPGIRAIQPEFAADERTNTLLVTASPEQLVEVDSLLHQLDVDFGRDMHTLRTISMAAALPSRAAELLEQIVVGSDQDRRATTLIVADDSSGVLLVRASPEVNAEIDAVLGEIDRDAAGEFEIRTITLEHAEADVVSQALQRFFDDRARIASSGRGRRDQARRISIIGDPGSNTLLVAASDDDYEQLERLVAQFDTPQAAGALTFRIFPLKHAKASDIEETVTTLINEITWAQGPVFWWGGGRGGRSSNTKDRGTLAVHADTRLNALIVTGEGDKFDVVQQLVEVLDAAPSVGDQRIVRLYRMQSGNLDTMAEIVRELYGDANRRWWEEEDPNAVKVRVDESSNTLIVSGTGREHEEIAGVIASIDAQITPADREVAVLPIEFAQATDMERMMRRFLRDRARATGGSSSMASIIASDSANSLVVSAAPDELATIRDLLAKLDQPDVSGDRAIEIVVIEQGDA